MALFSFRSTSAAMSSLPMPLQRDTNSMGLLKPRVAISERISSVACNKGTCQKSMLGIGGTSTCTSMLAEWPLLQAGLPKLHSLFADGDAVDVDEVPKLRAPGDLDLDAALQAGGRGASGEHSGAESDSDWDSSHMAEPTRAGGCKTRGPERRTLC